MILWRTNDNEGKNTGLFLKLYDNGNVHGAFAMWSLESLDSSFPHASVRPLSSLHANNNDFEQT